MATAPAAGHAPPRPAGRKRPSVESAFRLLEAIADAPAPAGQAELAAAADTTPAAAARLLPALAAAGYLHQPDPGRYALGARLARIARAAARQAGGLAQPVLDGLADTLRETASLDILDEDRVLCIAQADPARTLRAAPGRGRTAPASSTAAGIAILASLAPDTSRQRPPALRHSLDATRDRGYAIDDQEEEAGMRRWAVPIPDPHWHAAVTLSAPTARAGDDFAARAIPALKGAATRIASAIQARPE